MEIERKKRGGGERKKEKENKGKRGEGGRWRGDRG